MQGISSLVPNKYQAGWAPEVIWMLWRRKTFLPLAKNLTIPPQLSNLQFSHYTELTHLHYKDNKIKHVKHSASWTTHMQ